MRTVHKFVLRFLFDDEIRLVQFSKNKNREIFDSRALSTMTTKIKKKLRKSFSQKIF